MIDLHSIFGFVTDTCHRIVGLQLNQLSDQQKDELALLIAERTVVFFRDQ